MSERSANSAFATVLRSSRSGIVGRAGWSLIDQALSSLSNAALSLLVARASGVEGYGAFAVAFTVFTFVQGLNRGLVNNPYIMRFAGISDDDATREARRGTGLALLFGAGSAAVVVVIALVVGQGTAPSLATMAVLLPGLLVQDVWRSIFIARQRPRSAAANDALWTVLQFGVLAVLIVMGIRSPAALIGAWGFTGWIAAMVAVRWGGAWPSVRDAAGFARSTHDVSRYLVAEWLTVLGAAQLALLAISVIGSPADVGSLRAAQTLLGPLTVLVVATFGFVVPELARRPSLTDGQRRWVAVGVSAALGLLTLACGAALLLMPEDVGRLLLGEVWPGARASLPAMTLWMVGAALAAGPIAVIRSCGQARASFRVNVLIGLMLLVCVPAGFLVGGAPGASAGFAVANVIPVPLFWVQMAIVLRERRPQ